MPGRQFVSSSTYRYGFNGKENDKETVGTGGGTQDYGMRIYNPALGRFLSVDPLQKEFVWNSSYAFAEDKPIKYIDLDGGEKDEGDGGYSPFGAAGILVETYYGVSDAIGNIALKLGNQFGSEGYKRMLIQKAQEQGYSSVEGLKLVKDFGETKVEPKLEGAGEGLSTALDAASILTSGKMKYSPSISNVSEAFLLANTKSKQAAINGIKGGVHHLFTDKNFKAGEQWSKKFDVLFKRAGFDLNSTINKIFVAGHYGPHPKEYHLAVFDRLKTATAGLKGEDYINAFKSTLETLGKEVSTKGTTLNKLITKTK